MYKKADFFPGSTLGPTTRPSTQPPSTQPSSKPVNKNNFTALGNTSQQIRQGGGQFQPAQAVANFNQGYNQFLAQQQARAQQQENAQRQRYEAGLRRYSVAMNNWEQGGRKGAQPTFSMTDWNTLTPAELAAKPKYPFMPNLAEQWGYNYNNTPVWARDEEPQAWMYEPNGINGAYDQQQWDNWMWNLRRSGMPGGVLSTFPQTPDWDKARDVMYWQDLAEAMGGDSNKIPFVHNRGSYNMAMGRTPDGKPVADTQINMGTTHIPFYGDIDNYTFGTQFGNRVGATERAAANFGNSVAHLPWNFTVGGIGFGREAGLRARAGLYDLVGATDLAKKTRDELNSDWWGSKAERAVYKYPNYAESWVNRNSIQPRDMTQRDAAKMDASARNAMLPLDVAMNFLLFGGGTGTAALNRNGLQALGQRAMQQGVPAWWYTTKNTTTPLFFSSLTPRDEYNRPVLYKKLQGNIATTPGFTTEELQGADKVHSEIDTAKNELEHWLTIEQEGRNLSPEEQAWLENRKDYLIQTLIDMRRRSGAWDNSFGGYYE